MLQETDGDFRCLMGSGFGSSMPGLPSWVRDFSHSSPVGVVPIEERRMWYDGLYQASTANRHQLKLSEDRELHYQGTYAETVKAIGPHIPAYNAVFGEALSQWFELCKETMGTCEPRVLRNTFYRIICADVCKQLLKGPEFRRARETDFPEEEDVWNRLLGGDIFALDFRGYGWGMNFGLLGRCYFTTFTGKMGLCHANTLPGDEVWVMSGVQVPFIVRALEPADAGCAKTYMFLGDCFLDGIMDGELGEKEKSMQRPIVMV